jgi:hypothetical protein
MGRTYYSAMDPNFKEDTREPKVNAELLEDASHLELVLIEVPVDFNPKLLHKSQVDLQETGSGELNDEFEWNYTTDSALLNQTICLFPSSSGLRMPKKIRGHVRITRKLRDLQPSTEHVIWKKPRAPKKLHRRQGKEA